MTMTKTERAKLVERGMQAWGAVAAKHPTLADRYRASFHPSTDLPLRDPHLFCHVWESLRANPHPDAVKKAQALYSSFD